MAEILIADIETNAIHNPNVIWMLGVLSYDSDEFTAYVGEEQVVDGLLRLVEADCIIGHNFLGYDTKHITRLTNGLVTLPKRKIIDTCKLSKTYTALPDHKLKTWGDLFGFPKGDYTDFDRFDPEMIPYCERDCRISKKIFEFVNELAQEHGSPCLLESFR